MKDADGWWGYTAPGGSRFSAMHLSCPPGITGFTGAAVEIRPVAELTVCHGLAIPTDRLPGLIAELAGGDDPKGYDPGADWKRAKYNNGSGGITVETDGDGFLVTVAESFAHPDEWEWTGVAREDVPSLIAKLAEGVGTEDLMTVIGCLARMMCARVEENERNEGTR